MTITAGMTSSSFDVDIIDNMIQDGDKMFTITITRLMSSCLTLPATVDSETAMVTISDDEGIIKETKVITIQWNPYKTDTIGEMISALYVYLGFFKNFRIITFKCKTSIVKKDIHCGITHI